MKKPPLACVLGELLMEPSTGPRLSLSWHLSTTFQHQGLSELLWFPFLNLWKTEPVHRPPEAELDRWTPRSVWFARHTEGRVKGHFATSLT